MPELTETQSTGGFYQCFESGSWAREKALEGKVLHHVLALKKPFPGFDN
jgi:hypothetical protein